MIIIRILCIILLSLQLVNAEAEYQPAITKVIPINDLINYGQYPNSVKELINKALLLTQQNLTYTYGSANPDKGGMDCSGTIYYLLSSLHIQNVPRSSNEQYVWTVKFGKFYSVTNNDFNSSEFANLQPGDLLFWENTYAVKRYPPISHVMIYLGKNSLGKPLMFGASNGRTYQGQKMWGVSVFDFILPKESSSAKFVGYSCIPTYTCPH